MKGLGRRGPLRVLLIALALALTLAAFDQSAASPKGTIVIRGAETGSHLVLSVEGNQIVVDGYLAPGSQSGCKITSARLSATCSSARSSSIEIRMGGSGDLVEVLDRLPMPLTAYLGGGSDKMIANGERDTCYPGGSRRNRCTLGGGDDVCITGNRNSDCVGGAGNDFCEHGAGSDGCWGGPGNDICVMRAGQDGCHGGPGADRLYGGPDPDQLYGGPGHDFCDGGRGIGRSHQCEAGPGR